MSVLSAMHTLNDVRKPCTFVSPAIPVSAIPSQEDTAKCYSFGRPERLWDIQSVLLFCLIEGEYNKVKEVTFERPASITGNAVRSSMIP